MFKIIFLVKVQCVSVSVCDLVIKFVDKMTSCQFGSWKEVLTDDNCQRHEY